MRNPKSQPEVKKQKAEDIDLDGSPSKKEGKKEVKLETDLVFSVIK